jgi:hypothetical protein
MAIRIRRFPEHGVTVAVASGVVSPEQIEADVLALEPDSTPRWINYLDPTIDLSAVDVAFLPSLRRLVAAKLREVHGDEGTATAWVSSPGVEEVFRRFWPNYTRREDDYPADLAEFATIEAACDWLGLSAAGRAAVIAAIRDEADDAPQRAGADWAPPGAHASGRAR